MDSITITERLSDIQPDVARKLAQRYHRKKEEFEMVRKFYLADAQSSDDDERTITARVSTPDVDRDGEVVLPEGIDTSEYVKNNVLLWAHDYSKPSLGRSVWPPRIDKSGMVCKFQFANTQFADEVYQLYRDGYMKAFSIGFIPVEYDKATKTHKRVTLLEISCVPVPANQNALVMEAYQKGIVKSVKLKHDLGLDAVTDTAIAAEPPAIEPETKEGADVETKEADGGTVSVAPALTGEIPSEQTTSLDAEPDTKDAPVSAPVETAPETKAALDTVTVTLEPDQVAAALMALNERLAGIEARLAPAPAPVVTIEPVAITPPADFITLDPAPEIDLSDIQPALVNSPAPAQAPAPKSIETMTEDEVIAAVGKAIAGLDLSKQIKELVDLALDKARGRVR